MARRDQREQLAPVAPGVQARVLVLAEDQEPLGAGLGGSELAHRVEREAGAAPAQLDRGRAEARLAGDRQAHHRLAVGAVGEAARLLPRLADRNPAQLVELELLERELGERDVGVVDRVEAAAEQADPPHSGHDAAPSSAAQSRGRQEIAVQARLGRTRLGPPVVAPGHDRRHRHQDALGAPARLQAEQRAAVVDQVELDVAAAPVGLEVALALAVGGGTARRTIGR